MSDEIISGDEFRALPSVAETISGEEFNEIESEDKGGFLRATADVLLSVVRGPLKAVDKGAELLFELGVPDLQINIGNDRPFIENRSKKTLSSLIAGDTADGSSLVEAGRTALGKPETVAGEITETFTQWLTGMVGATKVLRAANILQGAGWKIAAARGVVADSAATFVSFEAAQSNLFDLLKEHTGARGVVVDYLAGDLAENELDGRLANALSDAGIAGVTFEGLVAGVRMLRAWRKASKPERTIAVTGTERETPDSVIDNATGAGAEDVVREIAGGTRGFAVTLSPKTFLQAVPDFTPQAGALEGMDRTLNAGRKFGAPYLEGTWDEGAQAWNVRGHEGRNRSKVLAARFGDDAPLTVYIDPYRADGTPIRPDELTDAQRAAPFVNVSTGAKIVGTPATTKPVSHVPAPDSVAASAPREGSRFTETRVESDERSFHVGKEVISATLDNGQGGNAVLDLALMGDGTARAVFFDSGLAAGEEVSEGAALSLYREAAREAEARGLKLTSDFSVSEGEAALWDRLIAAGVPIERNPAAVADALPTPRLKTADGSPVYRATGAGQAAPSPAAPLSAKAERPAAVAELVARISADKGPIARAAARLAGSEVAGKIGAKVGGVNTRYIDFSTFDGDPQDVVNVLGHVEAALKEVLGKQYGGRISLKETAALAADLKDTYRVDLAPVVAGDQAAALLAKQMVMDEAAANLATKAATIRTAGKDASLAMREEFILDLQRYAAIHATVRGAVSEAGRTLNALKVMKEARAANEAAFADIARTMGFDPESDRLIKQIVDANGNLKQINAAATKSVARRIAEGWLEVFYSNLLSSPWTHAVNTLSGVGKLGQMFVERPAGAVAGALRASYKRAFGRAADPDDRVMLSETLGQVRGFAIGVQNALRIPLAQLGQALKASTTVAPKEALQAFRDELAGASWGTVWRTAATGEQILGSRGLDLTTQRRALYWATRENPVNTYQRAMNGFRHLFNATGAVIRIPGRAIATADTFFKTVAYESEKFAQVYRRADLASSMGRKESLADTAREMIDFETGQLKAGAGEIKEIDDAAAAFARYTTYQEELGPIMQKVEGAIASPLARVVVPFIRTPTNIVAQEFGERTPLGLLSAQIRRDIMNDGAVGDMARARLVIGTSSLLAVIYGTDKEWLRGGGVTGSNSQDLDRVPGYTVKIGDRWYAFNRYDPLGSLLGLAVDIRDILTTPPDLVDELATGEQRNALAASIMAAAKYAQSKTWLTGVSDLLQFMEDPERRFDSVASSWLANLLPLIPTADGGVQVNLLAGAQRAIAAEQDPVLRQAFDMLDRIRARLPGKEAMSARRDYLGRPMIVDRAGPFLTAANPTDPLERELHRLAFGYSMPSRTLMGVKLKADEYSRFLLLRGQTPQGAGNESMESALRNVIQSPQYEAFTNDSAKVEVIKRIVTRYGRVAKIQMYETDLDFRNRVDNLKGFEAFLLTDRGEGTVSPFIEALLSR